MAKNWAIAIGINQYNKLIPLKYAKRDAELMRNFFTQEAKFDEVCFFSDEFSELKRPNGQSIQTQATIGNLINFLHDRFEKPFLSTGDNCWFFFAGHGTQHANRDYLFPQDGNLRAVEQTAIPISYVRERLSRSGADNVILILDACRTEGSRNGTGIGNEDQQGIITISACSPTQISWEIDALGHGAFTYALWEALHISGDHNCATVERLDQFLRYRVSELCRTYGKFPEQNPRISVDPIVKSHFILLPQHATLADIAALKNDAYRIAFVENNPDLAIQLCIRANAVAMGRDMEVMELYSRLQQLKAKGSQIPLQSEFNSQSLGNRKSVVGSRQEQLPSTQLKNKKNVSKTAKVQKTQQFSTVRNLSSEVGTDYRTLKELLEVNNWRKADEETFRVMLQIAKREKELCLTVDSIKDFPCIDLRTINQLWVKYSNGNFGFSVQKKIWQESGSPRLIKDDWEHFGRIIGWCDSKNRWLDYDQITFNLSAPPGHLPLGWCIGQRGGRGYFSRFVYLFSRVGACKL